MSKSDDNYVGLVLEQIRDEIKVVHELVAHIDRKVENQPTREEFNELKDETRVIKAAVIDQNKHLLDSDRRLSHLEANAA